MNQDAWAAKCAAALCAAARWLFAASIGLALVALLAGGYRGAWMFVGLIGVPQVLLAARVEFDRVIFEAFSVDSRGTAGFDTAMSMQPGKAGRAMAERVRGVARLVSAGAALFAVQLVIAAVCAWRS